MSEAERKKVAFLFPGSRKKLVEEVAAGRSSDMPLYGMNHVAPLLEGEATCEPIEFAGTFKTYRRLRGYDVVVSSIGLNVFLLQTLFMRRRPRWIFFNINMTSVLSNYAALSPKRLAILFLLKCMHKVLCLSADQMKYLEHCGIPRKKLELVLFGTDKRFFTPSQSADDYILSVGKDQARDYSTLFEAAVTIPAQFVVVASRRNIEGEGIRDIPKNVRIEYDVDFARVRPLFQKALFVVVPVKKDRSRDGSDCSGQTVVLDALACGKAVVASKRAWTSDYVVDGTHVLLAEPENEASLQRAMQRLLDDPALRERMGAAGRALVEEKCNTELLGERIAGTVREALSLLR